jgi:hypothetical protein
MVAVLGPVEALPCYIHTYIQVHMALMAGILTGLRGNTTATQMALQKSADAAIQCRILEERPTHNINLIITM